jgi:hypothetical protein
MSCKANKSESLHRFGNQKRLPLFRPLTRSSLQVLTPSSDCPDQVMDPLSVAGLAGTVAQLIQVTGEVVVKLYRYYLDVKKAANSMAKLREEIALSLSLLGGLHEALVTKGEVGNTDQLARSLELFDKMLNELNGRIAPEKAKGIGKWIWPFSKEKNSDMIATFGRYNHTFQLALEIDQRYVLRREIPYNNLLVTR